MAPLPTDGAGLNDRLVGLLRRDGRIMAALHGLEQAALPDAWLCSGAIRGCVWNALTGRAAAHGMADIDLIYHDAADLSRGAENAATRRLGPLAARLGVPVTLHNQARVHLWFPDRFGLAYPALRCATDSLRYYPVRCTAVAARLAGEIIEIAAPFGLGELFAMAVHPNPALDNRAAYAQKTARLRRFWPEAAIAPWPVTAGW